MKKPPLRSFRTENFKAIRDSGRIDFGWLTVFIGNNGVGKSSLVEALETFRDIVLHGVDSAFHRWRGFEHVWNKAHDRKLVERIDHRPGYSHALKFRFDWKWLGKQLLGQQSITQGPGGNSLFIQQEQLIQRLSGRTERWTRNDLGEVQFAGGRGTQGRPAFAPIRPLDGGASMLAEFAWESFVGEFGTLRIVLQGGCHCFSAAVKSRQGMTSLSSCQFSAKRGFPNARGGE
jgi:hypothetical protein